MATATTKKTAKKTINKTATKAANKTGRKTTARKPAAKRATTRKSAAKPAAKPVVETAAAVQPAVASMVEDVTERIEDMVNTTVRFARDAAHTYIGMGVVVQDRIVRRSADTARYDNFLDEAKAKGADRVNEIQGFIEPIVQRVADRFEPLTERFEANLPAPVKGALETSRQRVRTLLAA
jgi:hypothetical protein